MNNEVIPIKMAGWLKGQGFPVSGLKEGCDGLIGLEVSVGTVPGEGGGKKGPYLHSQVPALPSPRSASCLGSWLGNGLRNRTGPLGKPCVCALSVNSLATA